MVYEEEIDILLDKLGCPIEIGNQSESLWNDKCDYLNISECTNLNPSKYNMNILQLSIRSLLAHQHELKVLLQQLCNKNSPIDVVALSETFLTQKVEKLVNIFGYILHSNCQTEHKGCGVCLLIKKGICYRPRRDLGEFIEKESEHIFIEIISKCGKKIIMGSSYRAPNTNSSKFTNHVKKVITKVQSERDEKELILCMDHNLDLLKCHLHEPTRAFLNNLVEKGVFSTITRPY